MRLTVITDASGRVTGLIREVGEPPRGAPTEMHVLPAEGQFAYEVEVPPELERHESPADLFAALAEDYRVESPTASLVRRH